MAIVFLSLEEERKKDWNSDDSLSFYTGSMCGHVWIDRVVLEAIPGLYSFIIDMIFDICALSDFEIEGRIVLVDKRSGKVWR